MEYIKRSVEELVEKCDKNFKCILVTGARQTGKSTMLKKLFRDKKYVSFDDPFIEAQAKDEPETFMALNAPPVVFDEAQRATELFRYIKIKCDEEEGKGLFCLSGSQPFELMKNASESLSGRVGIIELGGLSLREIAQDPFNKPFLPTMEYVLERGKTAKDPKNIWEIIHRGSYPELQDKSVDWGTFYASYVKTYLERDVRSLSVVQNLDAFRKFMVAVAARTGQLLNYSNIADEIGKDQTTVKNWISILESSGIIYLLEPYAASALKRAIKTPKLYFRDTGLAAYLTRWLTPETLAVGAMSGAFFETFVVAEILKSYSNCGVDYRYCVSYYRGKDKLSKNGSNAESEIDLIVEENGTLYPVEIKSGAKVAADATAAFTVLDRLEGKRRGMGAIVCMCPQPGALRDNVLQIPVWYV